MSTLLVTGGAGFIGANFVRHRLAERPAGRLVVLDALTYAGNRANLAGWLAGDPARLEKVRAVVDDDDHTPAAHAQGEGL